MIITVTLNPAFDKTYTLTNFKYGDTNIVKSIKSNPGGKGINVSRALLKLGKDSLAIGVSCREFADAVRFEGISEDFVITDTPTRTNIKILDATQNITTELNDSGKPISESLLCSVQKCLEKHLTTGDVVIFSGSLPPSTPIDIYRQWIDLCHSKNSFTILDTSSFALREGLKATPHIVKPNLSELEFLLGKKLSDNNDIFEAASELISTGVSKVIASLGSKGAIFVSNDAAFFGKAPKIAAKSTVGAGDVMVAACAFGKVSGLTDREMFTTAVAAGSASAMTGGSFDKSQITELMDMVEISKGL
jgi:1-phosphofructokinase